MRMLTVGAAGLGALLAGPVVSAHHSFSAESTSTSPSR